MRANKAAQGLLSDMLQRLSGVRSEAGPQGPSAASPEPVGRDIDSPWHSRNLPLSRGVGEQDALAAAEERASRESSLLSGKTAALGIVDGTL